MQSGQKFDLIFGQHPHSRQDNKEYARFPGGRVEEFSGHRNPTRITVETYNYMKESELSGDEIRKGGNYRIEINGRIVADGFGRDIEYMMDTAKRRLSQLMEHTLDVWREGWEQKSIGRKVWYYNTPAVIESVTGDGCLMLVPDPGFKFSAPWMEDDDEGEYSIKCELDCPHIWWFRE